MIQTLIDHTVDVDKLPDAPIVLDVGCRGFAWDLELLKLRPNAQITALDPDPDVAAPDLEAGFIRFLRMAVTYRDQECVNWQGPGEGSYVCGGRDDRGYGWSEMSPGSSVVVPNTTIRRLMELIGVEHWDVVKLDCEGSEFGILENWPGPIATQISVEFHDFVDRRRWDELYFQRLFAGPLRDYQVVQHALTPIGPADSLGHWDSLLVLR